MNTLFPTLDTGARIWIWITDRRLSEPEETAVGTAVNEFLQGWTSHGRGIHAAFTVLSGQVLLLAGEISEGEISGCGIDESVRLLERIGRENGFIWSSALDVAIVESDSGEIRILSRTDFRRNLSEGLVGPETHIIDRSLTHLGELRARGLHRAVRDSWASRYLTSGSNSG